MTDYPLSEIQAQAISRHETPEADRLEREKIVREYVDTLKEIARLKEILDKRSSCFADYQG